MRPFLLYVGVLWILSVLGMWLINKAIYPITPTTTRCIVGNITEPYAIYNGTGVILYITANCCTNLSGIVDEGVLYIKEEGDSCRCSCLKEIYIPISYKPEKIIFLYRNGSKIYIPIRE